jgi:hypothetical protein
MEWIAHQHALLAHLPVAVGLLLPFALLASQRAGRGIRPWWTVARYLALAGILGTLSAFVSGFASGRFLALIPSHRLLPAWFSSAGPEALLGRHALLGGISLLVGLAAVWAMTRPRKDHQSLGLLSLGLGLAWCAVLLAAGKGGYDLAHRQVRTVPAAVPAPPPVAVQPAPPVEPDPEARRPLRALDFAALEAIHPDPVKSMAHGGRWIRAWASPEAAAGYRAGQPLPTGALVVLSSQEDRWGRSGPEVGPLFALEMKASGPVLSFYWGRIPMAQRPAFGGDSSVYWRGSDAHLEACRECHAQGMADPAQRSHWRQKRLEPSKAGE